MKAWNGAPRSKGRSFSCFPRRKKKTCRTAQGARAGKKKSKKKLKSFPNVEENLTTHNDEGGFVTTLSGKKSVWNFREREEELERKRLLSPREGKEKEPPLRESRHSGSPQKREKEVEPGSCRWKKSVDLRIGLRLCLRALFRLEVIAGGEKRGRKCPVARKKRKKVVSLLSTEESARITEIRGKGESRLFAEKRQKEKGCDRGKENMSGERTELADSGEKTRL